MFHDYTEQDDLGYSATLEMSQIDGDTMTDAGVRAADLHPIGHAVLSPGDPSPLGRTEDGDLAYPVFPDHTHLRLTRHACARLAAILAKDLGLSEMPQHGPGMTNDQVLLANLIDEALPEVLYPESKHGELARHRHLAALFAGKIDDIPFINMA